jgi:hypothetical protein
MIKSKLTYFFGYKPRVKKILITGFILVIAGAFGNRAAAQSVSRVGTSAANFLKIGVGAQALGMGEAFATQANDVSAIYWNPSGLSSIKNIQVLLNHYDYIADIYFDYGAVAVPLGSAGVVGFHFAYLGMPDIERTTIIEPEGTGEMVSASSYSAGLSYARFLTDRFSLGATIKLVSENLWHTSATGYALDIGLIYRSIFKNLKVGMSISNFGTSMQLDGRDLLVQHDIDATSGGNNSNINANLKTDAFSMPILFRVGISGNITRDFMQIENNDLILAVDAVHPNDNFEYVNIGGQYIYRDLLSLRAGYRQLFLQDAEGGLTFGFGLHFEIMNYGLNIDYAAVDYGRLDRLNKFSLILSL